MSEKYIPVGSQDVDHLVADIVRHRPDFIYSTLIGDSRYAFVKAYQRLGQNDRNFQADRVPIADCSLSEPELLRIGPEASPGLISSSVYFQSIGSDRNDRFIASYQACFGAHSITCADAEASYISVLLLASAIRRAGTTGIDAIRRAAMGSGIDAPQGRVTIDADNAHCYLTPRLARAQDDRRFEDLCRGAGARETGPLSGLAGIGTERRGGLLRRQTNAKGRPERQIETRKMMSSRIPNFRGHRALVLHPADSNREILVAQLARLGIESEVIWPMPEIMPDNVDVVFFDADRRAASPTDEAWPFEALPVIAITGTEAPGRLEAMLAVSPNAMLNKPLRREGIYKALVFAYHNQVRHRLLEEKVAFQQEQIRARSLVTKATLLVMRRLNIDEDEAFAAVRSASMSANLLVEAFAFSLMSDPNHYMKGDRTGRCCETGRRAARLPFEPRRPRDCVPRQYMIARLEISARRFRC